MPQGALSFFEIIHTDICGPFDVPALGGDKYFITYVNDFSHFGFIYLLKEISSSGHSQSVC